MQAMTSMYIGYIIFILFSFTAKVKSQLCHGMAPYDPCSHNSGCACFPMAGSFDIGICAFQLSTCSDLIACDPANNRCYESEHICVQHPQCNSAPVCYPVPKYNDKLCPIMTTTNTTTMSPPTNFTTTTAIGQQIAIPNIPIDAYWAQNATTIAGEGQIGNTTKRLSGPYGLFIDDNQTVIVADYNNFRIIQWKKGDVNGQIVAGGHGIGNRLDQFTPSDVLVDKETNSLIICDRYNQRIVRWTRRNGTSFGLILIDDIDCWGLAMDDQKNLYVSDTKYYEVRRYRMGVQIGTVVAGGNGQGTGLNQLHGSSYLFVDRQQNVYVSDTGNHRVMKWNKGAQEGIVVAGGQGPGNASTQLSSPQGIAIDVLGNLYVADGNNHRVTRWAQGGKRGVTVAGGFGRGAQANQLNSPIGLSFDQHGNLYVVDQYNHRVQRFSIIEIPSDRSTFSLPTK